MALFGRYYSQRDINLVNQINAELMRDIIETLVVLFKIAPNETNTNIYGEAVAAEGKSFYSGVELSSIIDRGDISTDDEGFGPDRDQTVVFKFRELSLKDASFYPEVGDLIFFRSRVSPSGWHCGTYIGETMFVHAANRIEGVKVSSLLEPKYKIAYRGAGRIKK